MKKYLTLTILSLVILSCTNPKIEIYPHILTSSYDSLLKNDEKSMGYALPIVYEVNISRSDTIDLNISDVDFDESFSDFGLFHNNKSDSLMVYADDQNLTFHSSKIGKYTMIIPPPPPPPPINGTIDSIHLKEIDSAFFAYQQKVKKTHRNMIPVYIYNASQFDLEVDYPIAGGDLFMILEAQDENGNWKPIEYFQQYGFLCGTGHQDFLLQSKKFIVAGVKRYEGSFQTQARVKLRNRNKTYYSNIFSMSINREQFDQNDVIDSISKNTKVQKIELLKKRLFLD